LYTLFLSIHGYTFTALAMIILIEPYFFDPKEAPSVRLSSATASAWSS
jgi:hypothetical protein